MNSFGFVSSSLHFTSQREAGLLVRCPTRSKCLQSVLGEVAIPGVTQFQEFLVLFHETGGHSLEMDFEFPGLALVVVRAVAVAGIACIGIPKAASGERLRQRSCRPGLPFEAAVFVLETGLFLFEGIGFSRCELQGPLGHQRIVVGSIPFLAGLQKFGPEFGLDELGLGGILGLFRGAIDGL